MRDMSSPFINLDSIDQFPATLFNIMSDGVLIVNQEGEIVECNKTFYERLGYSKEELIGKSVAELDPPEFASRVPERLALIHDEGEAVFETAHYRSDGSIMPVELNARFITIAEETCFLSIVRDITERKETENKLKKQEEKLQTLFLDAPLAIFIANLEGEFIQVNQAACDLLGYDCEELIGLTIMEHIQPEDLPKLERERQEQLAGKLNNSEWQIRRKDGSLITVEISSRILEDGRWQAFVQDISERIKIDEERQQHEAMYRALVETSADGFWAADNEGRFIEVNEAYLKRSGYTREEFLALRIPDIEAVESPEETRKHIEKIISEGHDRFESQHITKDGEVWPVEIVTTFWPLHGGVFLVYAVDISERKQAQESIEKQQQELNKLSHAIEQANEAVLITDIQGIIEYVNPAFTIITGYQNSEAIGQSTSILRSEAQDKSIYEDLWVTIASGKVWEGNLIDRRKDGAFYPALISIAPIFDDKGVITNYVSIQKDMTEFKTMERQLLQAQKMESMGTLVGGIAHDFNNMLAAVQGNLYLAKMDLHDPESLSEKLNTIERLSEQAALVVKQLLTFAKKDLVEMEEISLNSMVVEGFKLARSTIPENIAHHLHICSEQLLVEADYTQLQQAMINLSNNARDAVENIDKPEISWELSRYVAGNDFHHRHPDVMADEFACMTVKDNGSGIKKKHLQAIFDPFFTTKETGKGTGLGLAMVFGSVERHGGVLEVESEEGKGTSFHIYLPLLARKHNQPHQTSDMGTSHGSGKTILVVDDDDNIRKITSEVLRKCGYIILEACNGVEAKELFLAYQQEISLIISDVVMPEKSGVQLAEEIRQLNSDVPIILVSGYDQEQVTCKKQPVDHCLILAKPFSFQKLNQMVDEMTAES